MQRNLKKDFSIIIFLAAGIPVIVVSFLLYFWNQSHQNAIKLEIEEKNKNMTMSLRESFVISSLLLENFHQSNEFLDFIQSPKLNQRHFSNLIFSKVSELKRVFPFIDRVIVFDHEKKIIFPEGEKMSFPSQDGFVLEGEKIILRSTIMLDEQYQVSGHTSGAAFMVMVMDKSELLSKHSSIKDIRSIPNDLDLQKFRLDFHSNLEQRSNLAAIFLAFFAISILFSVLSLVLFKKWFFNPVKELTKSILDKGSNGAIKVESKKHELLILKETIERYSEIISDRVKEKTIVESAQFLAHDLARPFTLMLSMLNILEKSEENQMQQIVKEFIPDVQDSIKKMRSMLSDLMGIGNEVVLNLSPISSKTLIYENLCELLRYQNNANISFEYDLSDQYELHIDHIQCNRVFLNIIENALQAMNYQGKIWFRTKNINVDGLKFIEFCIGNSNSHINSNNLENVFKTFFTKGKKMGTGLGLSISKKIINAHGGKIWCNSAENGVGFYFTLPCNQSISVDTLILPASVDEIRCMNVKKADSDSNVIKILSGGKQTVVFVDDELLYLEYLEFIVKELPLEYLEKVKIHKFQKITESLSTQILELHPTLVILDIDLKHMTMDGYDIARQLRSDGYQNIICMHSNRNMQSEKDQNQDIEIEYFVEKPMNTEMLVLILEVHAENDVK